MILSSQYPKPDLPEHPSTHQPSVFHPLKPSPQKAPFPRITNRMGFQSLFKAQRLWESLSFPCDIFVFKGKMGMTMPVSSHIFFLLLVFFLVFSLHYNYTETWNVCLHLDKGKTRNQYKLWHLNAHLIKNVSISWHQITCLTLFLFPLLFEHIKASQIQYTNFLLSLKQKHIYTCDIRIKTMSNLLDNSLQNV